MRDATGTQATACSNARAYPRILSSTLDPRKVKMRVPAQKGSVVAEISMRKSGCTSWSRCHKMDVKLALQCNGGGHSAGSRVAAKQCRNSIWMDSPTNSRISDVANARLVTLV